MSLTDLPDDAIYARQYRRCGKPSCTVCGPGRRGHGPYWYAYWREAGRRRSRYLGKQAPAGLAVDVAPGPPPVSTPPLPVQLPATLPPLRVRTLCGFAVWRGAEALPPACWRRRMVARLFKLLLSAPGQCLHRTQVIEALWPEVGAAEGARRLRATVHLLRRTLDPPGAPGASRTGHASYLRSQGEILELAPAPDDLPAPDWLDATAFAAAAAKALVRRAAAACRAALALYGGEYLPEALYDDWALPRREDLRRDYLALLRLAEVSAEEGEATEAEKALRALLAVDPTHEAAAQRLMALLALEGRPAEALRVYAALAAALRDDLDIVPSAETIACRARILAQQAAPRAFDAVPVADTAAEHRVPTNVAEPARSFVGRERKQAMITALLVEHRLVTLTGTGGCGKTRLAWRVAGALPPIPMAYGR